jgi:hypothetical protein
MDFHHCIPALKRRRIRRFQLPSSYQVTLLRRVCLPPPRLIARKQERPLAVGCHGIEPMYLRLPIRTERHPLRFRAGMQSLSAEHLFDLWMLCGQFCIFDLVSFNEAVCEPSRNSFPYVKRRT